jgi:AP-1 complex subunit mu
MRAHFGLPSITSDEVNDTQWKVPIEVKFEIPYFTVSGLQVRYLKIIEKSGYQVLTYSLTHSLTHLLTYLLTHS